jgi:hypothetical protein
MDINDIALGILAVWPIAALVALVSLFIFSARDYKFLDMVPFSYGILFVFFTGSISYITYTQFGQVWHILSYAGVIMLMFAIWRFIGDYLLEKLETKYPMFMDPETKEWRYNRTIETIGVTANILALIAIIFFSVYFKILG